MALNVAKQFNGRLGIDGVFKANSGFKIGDIERAIDVQTLPAGMTLDLSALAALDPSASQDWVVLRMDGIHENHNILILKIFLARLVVLDKGFLLFLVGLARHELGLLVTIAETMQHGGHARETEGDTEVFLDPVAHAFSGLIDMLLQMLVELRQLRFVQERFTADIVHAQQLLKPASSIFLEV